MSIMTFRHCEVSTYLPCENLFRF